MCPAPVRGVIDLHNHILPGIDDGAADLDEALAIARQFAAEGVTQIAATPHFNTRDSRRPRGPAVREMVAALQHALQDQGIALTIVTGNEIFLSPDVPEMLSSGAALPLGDGNAVLVECSFDHRPLYLDDILFRLQLLGYQPVLVHPERYRFVQSNVESLESLVDRGIVLQLTAPSLLGEYGGAIQRTAEMLLRRGWYGCAASDRHHPGAARSLLSLHQLLTRMAHTELADLLLTVNPQRLLSRAAIERPRPTRDARQGRLSRFLSRTTGRPAPEHEST
ncbi:MAG: hypothetical protein NVS2B16_20700 [Chloroflexota bacterium]